MAASDVDLRALFANMSVEEISKLAKNHNCFVFQRLPQLGPRVMTSGGGNSVGSRKAAPCKGLESAFSLVPIKWSKTTSSLWVKSKRHPNNELHNGTEADIGSHCKTLLEDIAASIPALEQKLVFTEQMSITGLSPDVWLLAADGLPVGIMEVKRPGENVLSDQQVLGQLLNYMRLLRSAFGVQHVFGIITTYSEWRVCWLPDNDSAAQALTLPTLQEQVAGWEPSRPNISVPRFDDSSSDDDESNSGDEETEPEGAVAEDTEEGDGDDERILHCTPIYNSAETSTESTQLANAIGSVLLKMHAAPRVLALPPSMAPMVSSTKTWLKWTSPQFTAVTFSNLPNLMESQSLFLLHDLKGGRDGRVWLACSIRGAGCVLKFSRQPDVQVAKAASREEAQVWRHVYGPLWARSCWYYGRPAVLMPAVQPLLKKPDDPKVIDAVRRVVKLWAQRNRCHNDLGWHHVALYTSHESAKLEAVLIDASDVKVTTTAQRLETEHEMLSQLGLD